MSCWSFSYGDLLERNARLFGDLPAVLGRDECVTHRDLYARALALAGGLANEGVQPGDRLAVLSENRCEVMELLGAAAWLGACLVPLNTRLARDEVLQVLGDATPRMIFVSGQCAHLHGRLPVDAGQVVLPGPGERGSRYAKLLHPAGRAHAADDLAPLLVIYTAAVDGRPRGAVLSHRSVLSAAVQLQGVWRLGPQDRTIGVLPLSHVAGLGLVLAVQAAGGATLLEPGFDADRVVALAEDHGGSVLTCFPPMLGTVLDRCEVRGSHLRHLRVVSGLEAADTIGRLRACAPHAVYWSVYGQTETCGTVCLTPYDERPGAAGRPMPLSALRIVGEAGEALGPGVPGDILVRGPTVFSGYWPLQNERPETCDGGWHRTGDRGSLDDDGYLWFDGRSADKRLIKSGGENVYPAEVEQVLRTHPALADVAVVGVPDATWGEAVKAVCVLRPGASATAGEITEFVAARLARFKRPKVIEFVTDKARKNARQ